MPGRGGLGRRFKVDRLSWRLGTSIAVVVICGQLAGFLLTYRLYRAHVLEQAREHAVLDTALIRQALEYQMLEKDDRLLREMVHSYAREDGFQRVMILDREGEVRVSSDPAIRNHHFDPAEPTCQVCHQHPAAERERSTLLVVDGGEVLRCAQPIPNRPTCYGCHDPAHRINGLILVDVPLTATLSGLEEGMVKLAMSTIAIALLLLGALGLVFRRLVLRRLFRFEATARAMAKGDLTQRVPVEGGDALARVEDQFNHMADSVSSLLTQVRQQRANLENVMNSVDDGMVVLDPLRTVVAANDAFFRRFPGSGPDIIGKRCCAQQGEGGMGCAADGVCPTEGCFADAQGRTVIRRCILPDGHVRVEEVRASPVFSPDGRVTHVVEVWRDITDRRSAEAQLAEYQRLVSLGMLAAGFSHEVNTPLASIGTCLDGIRRLSAASTTPETAAEVQELARIGATQVERCGTITQQFLRLARGKTLANQAIDLQAAAEAVVRLCRPTANEAGVAIEVAPAAGLPAVVANESAVQQVLLNLVLNAVQASPPGGTVRVAFAAGPDLRVEVEDGGRGISPEDLGRVFEPFFSRRERGTGLGLFVSMNLARGWGGDILVHSAVGRGSTFTLIFPHPAQVEPKLDGVA